MPRLYILKLLSVVVLATGSICPISLAASDSAESSICSAPLSVDEVVDNLVRRNQQREQSLQSTEATRVYHLEYRGFPSDREAQMTVHAVYSRPSFKSFAVISQNGSKLILDRVFKKLLESEKEAASAEMHDRTLLNRTNYDFALIRCEPASAQYVLQVTPKSKSKYVYHGQVWVDGADFAVTRIEAEPAQNPSFWTKRSQIHHEYEKIQGFWVPARNESISYIRLGGRATLTIEYSDYHVKGPAEPPAVSSAAGVK
jgi:hypothetical protein